MVVLAVLVSTVKIAVKSLRRKLFCLVIVFYLIGTAGYLFFFIVGEQSYSAAATVCGIAIGLLLVVIIIGIVMYYRRRVKDIKSELAQVRYTADPRGGKFMPFSDFSSLIFF